MGDGMIFSDFGKAIAQLADPRFRRVMWLGIALTIALLVAVYGLVLWVIDAGASGPLTLPFVGEVTWVGDLLGWGSLFFMLLLSFFLMIPVASAITSLFLDDVAAAVEAEHYPHLPPVGRVSLWDGIVDTASFFALLIVANVLAFIAYAMLPFAAPLIFFGLNGFLLGREYFQIAAMRREGRAGAKALRKKHTGQIWLAGCLMAMPLVVPILNLVIPVLGAATFTHLYHRVAGTRSA